MTTTNGDKSCIFFKVIQFLNNLYRIFDAHMDEFDVYKVESISENYMVTSGIPVSNGDNHAIEISKLGLRFLLACNYLSRPDHRMTSVVIQAGIHTGTCTLLKPTRILLYLQIAKCLDKYNKKITHYYFFNYRPRGGRSGWLSNASLLPVWRHREHSIQDAIPFTT